MATGFNNWLTKQKLGKLTPAQLKVKWLEYKKLINQAV